jgi:hypothetical protein
MVEKGRMQRVFGKYFEEIELRVVTMIEVADFAEARKPEWPIPGVRFFLQNRWRTCSPWF